MILLRGGVQQTYAGDGANGCVITLVPLFLLLVPTGKVQP